MGRASGIWWNINLSLIQFGRKEKRTQTTVQSVEAALALEKKGKRRRIDKRMESGFSFHPFGSFDDGVTSLLSPFLLLSPQLLFLFFFLPFPYLPFSFSFLLWTVKSFSFPLYLVSGFSDFRVLVFQSESFQVAVQAKHFKLERSKHV